MMTKEMIRDLIAAQIDCSHIDVRGDDGAHFEATIVAPAFEGKSRVAIHALSFKTLTPAESDAQKDARG
jgi:acid stress-induced BolA-like protein IbaG/YrbA